MSRLVAFGCSMTYGHGLADCHIPPDNPGPVHSKLSWPAIVATLLGIEYVNNGICGASNKQILMEILKFPLREDDIVVVQWTYTHRSMIYEQNEGFQQVLPPSKQYMTKELQLFLESFYKIHTNYDLLISSHLDIHHANLYVTINNDIFNFHTDSTLDIVSPSFKIKSNGVNLYSLGEDIALDDVHPGPKCQQVLAKYIASSIKQYIK